MTREEAARLLAGVRADLNGSIDAYNRSISEDCWKAFESFMVRSEEYEQQADELFARAHTPLQFAEVEMHRVAGQIMRDMGREWARRIETFMVAAV